MEAPQLLVEPTSSTLQPIVINRTVAAAVLALDHAQADAGHPPEPCLLHGSLVCVPCCDAAQLAVVLGCDRRQDGDRLLILVRHPGGPHWLLRMCLQLAT
jgi:hypothetical protein